MHKKQQRVGIGSLFQKDPIESCWVSDYVCVCVCVCVCGLLCAKNGSGLEDAVVKRY